MKYFSAQIKTGAEEKYIRLFRVNHPDMDFPIHFLRRELREKHGGKVIKKTQPVFPGYIFLEMKDDNELSLCQWALRKTEGFGRFLLSNQNILPLAGKDLEIVLHFVNKTGCIAGISKVYFNSEDKIVVREGALSGLEGKIIKVDRRKGRAKVRLDLYNESFLVDLSFEDINKM